MKKRWLMLVVLAIGIFSIFAFDGSTVLANRPGGTLKEEGVGFLQLASDGRGYINVKNRSSIDGPVKDAIEEWQKTGQKYLKRDLFRLADDSAPTTDYEVEIIDIGMESELSWLFTMECSEENFPDYAVAGVLAIDTMGILRGTVEEIGFMSKHPGYPFEKAVVCLNVEKNINKTVVIHELGHALGLDHPNFVKIKKEGDEEIIKEYGECSDSGKNSVMAAYYEGFKDQWAQNLTKEDLVGPWICDLSSPGGVDYIYGYTNTPGMGNPIKIDVEIDRFNVDPDIVDINNHQKVSFWVSIKNNSNTTIYNVTGSIYALGETLQVLFCPKLEAGEICGLGYRYGYYDNWEGGSKDEVVFSGTYNIISDTKGGETQEIKEKTVSLEILGVEEKENQGATNIFEKMSDPIIIIIITMIVLVIIIGGYVAKKKLNR